MNITSHIVAAAIGAAVVGIIQERRIKHRETDTAYAMLARSGVEARLARLTGSVDIVFVDMDDFKGCNAKHGEPEVNQRMQRVFNVRSRDLLFIGRWQSGDEILIVTRAGQGRATAHRLQTRMQAEGLAATFGVVRSITPDRVRSIEKAYGLVHGMKNANVKGGIHGD